MPARCAAGLAREDLFTVVHDPFLSVTARYADIVLPAATYLETEDFYRAYGTYYMQYGPPRCRRRARRGRICGWRRSWRARMGLTDPVFRCPSESCWPSCSRAPRARSPVSIPTTLRDGRPIKPPRRAAQKFRTPSGKLEFYSETLAAPGLPPMPDWQPDPRGGARRGALAAAPPDRARLFPGAHRLFRASASCAGARGRPSASCTRTRRRARGLADGAAVRLFNERGAVGLVLRVSDEVLPGVVLVPGQRPDSEAAGGTINMLCSDRYTDIGEGATYQSTFLDVAAW